MNFKTPPPNTPKQAHAEMVLAIKATEAALAELRAALGLPSRTQAALKRQRPLTPIEQRRIKAAELLKKSGYRIDRNYQHGVRIVGPRYDEVFSDLADFDGGEGF